MRILTPLIYDYCKKLISKNEILFHDRASILKTANRHGFRQVNMNWYTVEDAPKQDSESYDSYFAKYLGGLSQKLGYEGQDHMASIILEIIKTNYPSATMQDLMGHQCIIVFEKV